MSRRIDTVFLDAGGVLLLPDEQAILQGLGGAGIDALPDRLARAHYAGMQALDLEPSELVWDLYNLAYLRALGVPDHRRTDGAAVLADVLPALEWNVAIESSRMALSLLVEAGIRVAVVSNSDGSVERLLRAKGIAQVGPGKGAEVSAVIDSHFLGVSKPDPAIFHHALELLGASPHTAVHVGDSVRFDVRGAEAAGIQPLHLDPFGLCHDDGHHHATELGELLDLLD